MIAIEYRRFSTQRPGPQLVAVSGATRDFDADPPAITESIRSERPLPELILPNVATGATGAAERCVEQYGGLAWSLAKRYFAVAADAEDAVQEAFVSLWRNADRFDPAIAAESTFVTMIFRRRIIDMARKRKRPAPEVNSLEAEQAVGATEQPAIELSEEAARVRDKMADLREAERRVIELGICQGLSQAKIAEVTGWPLGTVKSHARRGMQRLREMLEKEGVS